MVGLRLDSSQCAKRSRFCYLQDAQIVASLDLFERNEFLEIVARHDDVVGLGMMSYAPARIAWIAVSILPNAVMTHDRDIRPALVKLLAELDAR